MLMKEAGLTNAFASKTGGWVCVKQKDIVAQDPDAIILVDAAWDSAKKKVDKLYNTKEFCKLEAVTRASFVKIPFSATTLSPRNGPAALDLAVVSLHVRLGIKGEFGKSGVDFFDVDALAKDTAKSMCPLQLKAVPYVASDAGTTTAAAGTMTVAAGPTTAAAGTTTAAAGTTTAAAGSTTAAAGSTTAAAGPTAKTGSVSQIYAVFSALVVAAVLAL